MFELRQRRIMAQLTLCAASALLAGCGGGDSSGGTIVEPTPTPTASPTATPTTTPSPTPTSTTITFTTPYVARELESGSGRRVSDAQAGGAQLVLTEPDPANEAVIENVTFNGNETYAVTQPNTPGSYDQRFLPAAFTGRGTNVYVGAGIERPVPQLGYQNGGTSVLILPQLEEVRKTAATATTTGNVTDHVRLADVRVFGANGIPDHRGLQLFGTRTSTRLLPATGVPIFVGEAFCDALLSTGQQDCIGDAVVNVDYARATVTGQITIAQYLGSTPARPTLTVDFVADIVDGAIVGRTLTVRGVGIFESGTIRGAFYGTDADEIGLVFSASGAAGNIIGGLVAGVEPARL